MRNITSCKSEPTAAEGERAATPGLLIINADDYGRSRLGTDRALSCYRAGSITSVSAMVFMKDSERSADLAKDCGIDVGLHINLTERPFRTCSSLFADYHDRVAHFLSKNKYNFLIYNHALRKQFEYVFQTQLEEFERLYGRSPSHIDGHHHMHLCSNMLVGNIIPKGERIRRNFTFMSGEKPPLNRFYRAAIDKWISGKYLITDYFFALSERIRTGRIARAIGLAKTYNVELETHPEHEKEFGWLTGSDCAQAFSTLPTGTFSQLTLLRNRRINAGQK